jgi:membrane-associated phospholipid phosphatase
VMVCAEVTAQVLKPLLAVQRDFPPGHYMPAASFPSGHATAAMSFALALAIVASPRVRPLVLALGTLLTVGTVYSLLILASHYPSDVIGGLLVASGWACLAVVPLRAEARPSLRALAGGPVLAGIVLTAVLALAAVAQPARMWAYAEENTTFLAGAVAIAAAALLLSGSVLAPTAARRRRPPDSHRARG